MLAFKKRWKYGLQNFRTPWPKTWMIYARAGGASEIFAIYVRIAGQPHFDAFWAERGPRWPQDGGLWPPFISIAPFKDVIVPLRKMKPLRVMI